MASIGHHLARRALDVTQEHFSSQVGSIHGSNPAEEPQDDTQIKQLATWGIALLWITAMLYIAMVSAVSLTRVACFMY